MAPTEFGIQLVPPSTTFFFGVAASLPVCNGEVVKCVLLFYSLLCTTTLWTFTNESSAFVDPQVQVETSLLVELKERWRMLRKRPRNDGRLNKWAALTPSVSRLKTATTTATKNHQANKFQRRNDGKVSSLVCTCRQAVRKHLARS